MTTTKIHDNDGKVTYEPLRKSGAKYLNYNTNETPVVSAKMELIVAMFVEIEYNFCLRCCYWPAIMEYCS